MTAWATGPPRASGKRARPGPKFPVVSSLRPVSPFRVVIAGGGIAALEGLLRLRRLAGDSLEVTLLAPDEELRYRPLAVDEPFARRHLSRYPLRAIARRTGADWVQDGLEWLDPDAQVAHTSGGSALPYDALLLAIG